MTALDIGSSFRAPPLIEDKGGESTELVPKLYRDPLPLLPPPTPNLLLLLLLLHNIHDMANPVMEKGRAGLGVLHDRQAS